MAQNDRKGAVAVFESLSGEKAHARRKRILTAAHSLFVDQGFHSTGMAQISAVSDVAIGQIYRDFANKEAIIGAICHDRMSAWIAQEELEDALRSRNVVSVRSWVTHISVDDPTREDRRLMCEILSEVGRNERIAIIIRSLEGKLRDALNSAFRFLYPHSPKGRIEIATRLALTISWGLMTRSELAPEEDSQLLRHCAAMALELFAECTEVVSRESGFSDSVRR